MCVPILTLQMSLKLTTPSIVKDLDDKEQEQCQDRENTACCEANISVSLVGNFDELARDRIM